jgi:hypothetical protein
VRAICGKVPWRASSDWCLIAVTHDGILEVALFEPDTRRPPESGKRRYNYLGGAFSAIDIAVESMQASADLSVRFIKHLCKLGKCNTSRKSLRCVIWQRRGYLGAVRLILARSREIQAKITEAVSARRRQASVAAGDVA